MKEFFSSAGSSIDHKLSEILIITSNSSFAEIKMKNTFLHYEYETIMLFHFIYFIMFVHNREISVSKIS